MIKNIRSSLTIMNLDEFKQQLKSRQNPVLVDFWATWCAPCRSTKPILESIAREYEGRVDFWAINADEHPQLLRELGIFGIPTVLITRAGEIIHKVAGAQSRENYWGMFEVLTNADETAAVSMSAFDRFLRLLAGTSIATVGLMTNAWFLVPIGGIIAFLGIHDRCPIWRAITTQFNKRTP